MGQASGVCRNYIVRVFGNSALWGYPFRKGYPILFHVHAFRMSEESRCPKSSMLYYLAIILVMRQDEIARSGYPDRADNPRSVVKYRGYKTDDPRFVFFIVEGKPLIAHCGEDLSQLSGDGSVRVPFKGCSIQHLFYRGGIGKGQYRPHESCMCRRLPRANGDAHGDHIARLLDRVKMTSCPSRTARCVFCFVFAHICRMIGRRNSSRRRFSLKEPASSRSLNPSVYPYVSLFWEMKPAFTMVLTSLKTEDRSREKWAATSFRVMGFPIFARMVSPCSSN